MPAKRVGAGGRVRRRAVQAQLPRDARQPAPKRPITVAIVGGGCGGLAAAWQLAIQPGYRVHVFERSWRLGGKGASARDAAGRIHEHGLHVWLGFYENAFRMMRECYREVQWNGWGPEKEAGKRLPHGSIEDAFMPEPNIGVAGTDSRGQTVVWSGLLPPTEGLPGEPLDADDNPFTLTSYLLRCLDLLKTLMLSIIEQPGENVPGKPRPEARSATDEALDLDFAFDPLTSPALVLERMTRLLRGSALTGAAAVLQVVKIIENLLHLLNFQPQIADSAVKVMEAIAAQGRKLLQDIVEIDPRLRWKTEIIDIVITIAVGLYRDRVLFGDKGLDAINDIDYREWLKKHGATKTALESRFITGIYDFVFAYENGERSRPALAAGVALRGALRMFFTYRGALFWRMRSGMGDAVFAPLFKVLSAGRQLTEQSAKLPPVKFHFLHDLKAVTFESSGEGVYVSELRFSTGRYSARELDGLAPNALDEFGCWPDSAARFAKAETNAAPRELVLSAGVDFDIVILATGLEDFRVLVAQEQAPGRQAPEACRRACEHGRTVATKSGQVWLSRSLEQLGWYRGPAVITALPGPFETWADMTHTLTTENEWRRSLAVNFRERARSVAYFCGVIADEDIRGRTMQTVQSRVRRELRELLSRHMRPIWPEAFGPDGKATAWDLLVGQCKVTANVAGSDRYTLSLPGSVEHRLSPLDRSVLNMTVAGDWTACGIDAGCVESAVISGMLAAHAVSGEPELESIIGYDHP